MPPSSSDLCTISGYLYDVHGQPLKGYKIVIRYINQPFVFENDTIFANQYQAVYSDSTGAVSFKLLRGAKVKIEINNLLLNIERICTIPDAATAELVSVVYPDLAS
jgi:hypothetical protein